MKLTEEQVNQVLHTIQSPGWGIFETYLAEEEKSILATNIVPADIAGIIEREQSFGRAEALRTVVSDFKHVINNIKVNTNGSIT